MILFVEGPVAGCVTTKRMRKLAHALDATVSCQTPTNTNLTVSLTFTCPNFIILLCNIYIYISFLITIH